MMGSSFTSARENGWKWYYTGKPCKHGHVAPRLASNGRCKTCHLTAKNKLRQTPKHRAWRREYDRRYYGENMHRRDWVIRATPSWSDKKAVREFCKACPPGYHVDHIFPLNGATVCGLHVIENLQYLPAKENISKSNSVPEIEELYPVCPIKI